MGENMNFLKFQNTFLQYCVIEPKFISSKTKNLVLVHGFGTDGRSWNFFVKENLNNRLHILNLPGCGNMYYPVNEIRITRMAKSVARYIDSLKDNNIILIGHSLGASIVSIAYMHIKSKSKINKIILMAPYSIYSVSKITNKLFLGSIKTESDFYKLQKEIFFDYQKTLKLIDEVDSNYYYHTMDFYKRNQKYLRILMVKMIMPFIFKLISKAYKKINCDFCIMLADHDKFVNNDLLLNFFKKNFKKINFLIYQKCGHGFFVEQHEKFLNDVENFVNE